MGNHGLRVQKSHVPWRRRHGAREQATAAASKRISSQGWFLHCPDLNLSPENGIIVPLQLARRGPREDWAGWWVYKARHPDLRRRPEWDPHAALRSTLISVRSMPGSQFPAHHPESSTPHETHTDGVPAMFPAQVPARGDGSAHASRPASWGCQPAGDS